MQLFGFDVEIFAVFAVKSLDASRRVNELLFSCVERMAHGTNFRMYLTCSAAGFEGAAATTVHCDVLIFRMYAFFHK